MIDASEHLGVAALAVMDMARREGVPVRDSEAFADACVALVECVDRFDANRGFQFSTFARIRCRGNAIDRLRERTACRRKYRINLQYQPSEIVTAMHDRNQAVSSESSELTDAVERAIAILDERGRFVIRQRMRGAGQKEIAAILGITKSRVAQIESQSHSIMAGHLTEFVRKRASE